jgi:ribosomal-protein-alanine N-acetyltransferase
MNSNFFKNFTEVKSKRVLIRKLTLDDAKDVFEFTSNPETSKILSWYPHQTIETTKNFLSSIIKKYENDIASQWAVELISERKVIGIAGFIAYFEEHSKGEIAYVLSPDYQNKGYMTEALELIINYGFDVMGLKRIEAKCEIDNFASEKVLQKLGMRLEGCCYSYLFRKGKFRDYKLYALLKNDTK